MRILEMLFGPPNIESLKTKRDIEGLIKALRHRGNPGTQRMAAWALLTLPDTWRETDQTLDHVATAIANIGGGAIEPLVTSITVGSLNHIQRRTLTRIGGLSLASSVPDIVKALAYENEYVRAGAAEALGIIGAPHAITAVPYLVKTLADKEPDVRINAVIALGEIGDPRAINALVEALQDKSYRSSNVRKEAALALQRLGWRPVDDTQRAFVALALEEWDALASMGMPGATAIKWLLELCSRPDDRTPYEVSKWRGAAIRALGKTRDTSSVDQLASELSSGFYGSVPDEKLITAAAEALADIGDPRAAAMLLRHLHIATSGGDTAAITRTSVAVLASALLRLGKTAAMSLLEKIGTLLDEALNADGGPAVVSGLVAAVRKSASALDMEVLRILEQTPDMQTRYMERWDFDPSTDEAEYREKTETLSFHAVRAAATQELAQRGIA